MGEGWVEWADHGSGPAVECGLKGQHPGVEPLLRLCKNLSSVCICCKHKYAVRKIGKCVPRSKWTLGWCIIPALIDLCIYMYLYFFICAHFRMNRFMQELPHFHFGWLVCCFLWRQWLISNKAGGSLCFRAGTWSRGETKCKSIHFRWWKTNMCRGRAKQILLFPLSLMEILPGPIGPGPNKVLQWKLSTFRTALNIIVLHLFIS